MRNIATIIIQGEHYVFIRTKRHKLLFPHRFVSAARERFKDNEKIVERQLKQMSKAKVKI